MIYRSHGGLKGNEKEEKNTTNDNDYYNNYYYFLVLAYSWIWNTDEYIHVNINFSTCILPMLSRNLGPDDLLLSSFEPLIVLIVLNTL